MSKKSAKRNKHPLPPQNTITKPNKASKLTKPTKTPTTKPAQKQKSNKNENQPPHAAVISPNQPPPIPPPALPTSKPSTSTKSPNKKRKPTTNINITPAPAALPSNLSIQFSTPDTSNAKKKKKKKKKKKTNNNNNNKKSAKLKSSPTPTPTAAPTPPQPTNGPRKRNKPNNHAQPANAPIQPTLTPSNTTTATAGVLPVQTPSTKSNKKRPRPSSESPTNPSKKKKRNHAQPHNPPTNPIPNTKTQSKSAKPSSRTPTNPPKKKKANPPQLQNPPANSTPNTEVPSKPPDPSSQTPTNPPKKKKKKKANQPQPQKSPANSTPKSVTPSRPQNPSSQAPTDSPKKKKKRNQPQPQNAPANSTLKTKTLSEPPNSAPSTRSTAPAPSYRAPRAAESRPALASSPQTTPSNPRRKRRPKKSSNTTNTSDPTHCPQLCAVNIASPPPPTLSTISSQGATPSTNKKKKKKKNNKNNQQQLLESTTVTTPCSVTLPNTCNPTSAFTENTNTRCTETPPPPEPVVHPNPPDPRGTPKRKQPRRNNKLKKAPVTRTTNTHCTESVPPSQPLVPPDPTDPSDTPKPKKRPRQPCSAPAQPTTLHIVNSQSQRDRRNTDKPKTAPGPPVTSPVPSKCTNHESDTSTQPPVYHSTSPSSSPDTFPIQPCSAQYHLGQPVQPVRTNLPDPTPRTLRSSSLRNELVQFIDGASEIPQPPLEEYTMTHHSHQQPTYFHVGNNQQSRTYQGPSHVGLSARGRLAHERNHASKKRMRSLVDVTIVDYESPVPAKRARPNRASQQQPNGHITPQDPFLRNNPPQQLAHAHEHDQTNPSQSAPLHNSRIISNAHSGPPPQQGIPQHQASPASQGRPPQSDAMQIDQRAGQPAGKSKSTKKNARIDNEKPSAAQQRNMMQLDTPNGQLAGSTDSRRTHLRSHGISADSQPAAGPPRAPTKASRKSLQKKTASPTGEYYGIRYGRDGFSGVATCWKTCSAFVVGYRDAVYELFDSWEKAERFSDRYGTGASCTHSSNCRHYLGGYLGGKRYGGAQKGSVTRLPWEHEDEPKVVSLVIGAAWLRFGIGSGIGGYGVFLSLHNPYNCSGLMEGNVTEMRLQLRGLLEALEIVRQHGLVKDGGVVELYTASEEVKNGIDHWLGRWDRSGQWVRDGKPVRSQDLWKAILDIRKELLKKGTTIHTIWVTRPHKVPALQQAISLARVVFNDSRTDGGVGAQRAT